METPLLKTKLYIPPVRSKLVSRPQLIECLDHSFRSAKKLTLLPRNFVSAQLLHAQNVDASPNLSLSFMLGREMRGTQCV